MIDVRGRPLLTRRVVARQVLADAQQARFLRCIRPFAMPSWSNDAAAAAAAAGSRMNRFEIQHQLENGGTKTAIDIVRRAWPLHDPLDQFIDR